MDVETTTDPVFGKIRSLRSVAGTARLARPGRLSARLSRCEVRMLLLDGQLLPPSQGLGLDVSGGMISCCRRASTSGPGRIWGDGQLLSPSQHVWAWTYLGRGSWMVNCCRRASTSGPGRIWDNGRIDDVVIQETSRERSCYNSCTVVFSQEDSCNELEAMLECEDTAGIVAPVSIPI